MASSFVSLDAGTKVAGFSKNGLLYLVQLITDSSAATGRRLLRILTFDPSTENLNTIKTVAIYQNQIPEQTGFHKACMNTSGTVLGIYVQYTARYWNAEQRQNPPSWFLEMDLDTMEVKRNPCSRVKLESNFSQLYHTETTWHWILTGYSLGKGFNEFEFHSFVSSDDIANDSQYFESVVLTIASPVSRGQQLGVLGDKLYSIYEDENSWKFSFYNLQENSQKNSPAVWHTLTIKSKSPSDKSPERIIRLFIVDGKLCALELSKADNELRLWKVERPYTGGGQAAASRQGTVEAHWNLWKTYNILQENYEAYDLQVSSMPVVNGNYLIVFKMFHLPRCKLQYSMDAVHVIPLTDDKKMTDLSSSSAVCKENSAANCSSTTKTENHTS